MIQIDNHWNYGKEYRDHMTAPEVEPEIPKWTDLYWTKKSMIDRDGPESYYVVTATANGIVYEGNALYRGHKLIIVEEIQIIN